MDDEKFRKYWNERYCKEKNWYDEKAMINQKRHRITQWILIVVSSITPVFVILDYTFSYPLLTAVAVTTSVIVAIASSVVRTFGFHDKWMNYRTVCETMKKEQYFYEACIDEYAQTKDREALFVERVESLISREHTLWITAFHQAMKSNIQHHYG